MLSDPEALRAVMEGPDLVLEAAAAAEVELPLAQAARVWLAAAEDSGPGKRDYSAVLARDPRSDQLGLKLMRGRSRRR